jgi:hypothetical protein
MDGEAAFCTMMTDSSDVRCPKPKCRVDQKKHWTFKNKKFAKRYAISVSTITGNLCWVSGAYPAATPGETWEHSSKGVGCCFHHQSKSFFFSFRFDDQQS